MMSTKCPDVPGYSRLLPNIWGFAQPWRALGTRAENVLRAPFVVAETSKPG